jgi:hypothetical protein
MWGILQDNTNKHLPMQTLYQSQPSVKSRTVGEFPQEQFSLFVGFIQKDIVPSSIP